MKAVIALCVILAVGVAHCGLAPTLVRTPSFDSAIIKSDRLGGNFAYSTVEGHAYAAVSPVVQRVTEPVAVSYTAHQVPLGFAAAPVAVSQPIYAHHQVISQPFLAPAVVSAPVVAQAPVFASTPVVGGIPSTPVVGGIASAPVAQPNPAPAPAQGTVVDADTVAVESA
ncbi:uncharacterized protein BDFB_004828 [Asbolus verrucosus]|uniref:Calphotin-like n=1 Tax=Asbolus verrucosus TaxID=1661398 RepID=A0A482VZE3_ASBVE|nr:uncharacterized protein BDFB_004828 [Asbolus verrucosus]